MKRRITSKAIRRDGRSPRSWSTSWLRKSSSHGAAASGTSKSSVPRIRSPRTGTGKCRSAYNGRDLPFDSLRSLRALEEPLMGRRETLVGIVGALLLVSAAAAAFAKAPEAPAQQPPPLTKFVTPLKGQVQVEFTEPQAR